MCFQCPISRDRCVHEQKTSFDAVILHESSGQGAWEGHQGSPLHRRPWERRC